MPLDQTCKDSATNDFPGKFPVTPATPITSFYCGDGDCSAFQGGADAHCSLMGWTRGHAIPVLAPSFPGHWCFCCCSCFGYGTPIEVAPGQFKPVEDIDRGDTVLAAGLGLQWKPIAVADVGGLQPPGGTLPALHVLFQLAPDDIRFLNVSPDHLFLLTSGKLKHVQLLAPGDKLRRADGGEAEIVAPVTRAEVAGVRSIDLGPFDGTDLDGHLLNSNGVATADFSVQRFFDGTDATASPLIDAAALAPAPLVAGTAAYLLKYAPAAATLARLSAAGLKYTAADFQPPRPLITVPAKARRFFTAEQAADVGAKADRYPLTNTSRLSTGEYVVGLAKQFRPEVVVLIDWDNDEANGYAWAEFRQRYVVVAGGLLRVKAFRQEGLSAVLSHLLAYHAGAACVGEADYDGMRDGMWQFWREDLFPLACDHALEQLQGLFDLVEAEHAAEDPEDRCGHPSLECRMSALQAALGLKPLPQCASDAPPP
jgi:hypothetical protein